MKITGARPAARRLAVAALALLGAAVGGHAESVVLKNGTVYRGTVDRDNTIVQVYDILKRVILRDTKVAKFDDDTTERYETFPVVQPLDVHGGAMPQVVVSVRSKPWDEFGRRGFEYVGAKLGRSVRMTQAIYELGPKTVKVRGVDGFWLGQLPTSQIPKATVLAILAKVDQKNQSERLRVGRFLIQAEWYPEARVELDRIAKDFPDPELARTIKGVRNLIGDLEARQLLAEIEVRRAAQQPKDVLARLKGFPTDAAPAEVLVAVREQVRAAERRNDTDRLLSDSLREAAGALPTELREQTKAPLIAMLQDLGEAPDAVRGRFEPFQKAKADPAIAPEARFARAISGWVAGAEGSTDDLTSALAYLRARDATLDYLRASADRAAALDALREIQVKDPTTTAKVPIPLATLARIAGLTAPPLRSAADETPGVPKLLRVQDDPNAEPTEYIVYLPPEYNPLRSYPTVLALHGNQNSEATPTDRMKSAVAWWSPEAARRGYIVVAPDYVAPNSAPDYRYTSGEHGAIELALRDAKRRFAVDSDRVFLGGQLVGGNAAWDFGLAHPDLFAGVVTISGLPAKYAWAYKDHAKRVPLFVALGDLVPAEAEVFFPLVKGLIAKNYDVTFFEHFRRGLEDFPEDAPAVFDWMSKRTREAHPKQFEVATGRISDDRFYGVVVREFAPRRTVAPEAVDPLGKNLKPATLDVKVRSLANLFDVSSSGARRLDVWLGPNQVDFSKKFEVRINGKAAFKGLATLDFEPFLEDLRVRGDRKQSYWFRVSANVGGARAQ